MYCYYLVSFLLILDFIALHESFLMKFQWSTAHNISILPQLISMNVGVIRNRSILWQNKLICRQIRTLRKTRCFAHALFTIFTEEYWALQWIRIPAGYMWTGEFDSNTVRADVNFFLIRNKNMRIQKYPDTCGRGLRCEFGYGCEEGTTQKV